MNNVNDKLKTGNWKLALLTLLLSARAVFGEATMKIQPPLIELNESATLSVEVRDTKNPQPPSIPNVPGLTISYAGQSTQHSWVNGKSDSFTSFNFQIYPQETGTFKIGPFKYGTQTLQDEIRVVAGAAETQQAQSWSDLLFAKLETDRASAYVQEPFNLTLSIYSKQGLQLAGNIGLNGMPQTGLPDLQWQEISSKREVIKGSIFEVRRFTARTRAMSSGVFEFKPAVTISVVVPNQNRRSRSPFDDHFFGSMFQRTETRPVDVPVERVTVDVKSLPDAGRPDGFNGAVGAFRLQTSANPTTMQVGDPITLQMVITGDGNFDRVMMPPLPIDDSFRLFGDPVRRQTDGTVIFEQVISPRSEEISEIPSIAFSFFDTQSGQYKTVRSAPIPISVAENANGSAQLFASKETVLQPQPEEHPFATESDVQRATAWLSRVWKKIRPWLWVAPALLAAWLAGFAGRKLIYRRKQDAARTRRQKAPAEARKALKRADQALRKEDDPAFFDALWQAVGGYFANRLDLASGEATPDGIAAALQTSNIEPQDLESTKKILMKIESHRYIPGSSGLTVSEKKVIKNEVDQLLKGSSNKRLRRYVR